MKKTILLTIVLFTAFTFTTFSQQELPPASKPDQELTKKEATARILDFQSRVDNLQKQITSLDEQLKQAHSDLDKLNSDLTNCNKEILNIIGATQADVDAFRQSVGTIEGKVRQLKSLSNDQLIARQDEVKALENDLNQLRSNKISVLPEFYDKIISLARDIKGLYREKKITTYTVGTWAENRDCLWNIAGNMEIYGDPFLWPKIWQANTDKIKNPDIIHPGQVLSIPDKASLTTDEKKAERRYWRNKHAQMEATTTTQPTQDNQQIKPGAKGE
ncbi:MAG TPA: LysM peptidoglycan-binding domain-containing protein [Candidatus Kapabacteria bacterium]|jgi:nucleoid-associated protein YgaU|nr:LysM peptidoglycan-binding domain-containing protein [Candidatus Kapabacteria bacterium]HOV91556.1 LysM peptidoglycan-binding domain-containing protein [Candidatus Kapabacteria bacterium]